MGNSNNILFVMNWPDTTGLMLRRAHDTYELLAKSLKQNAIECYIAYPDVQCEYVGSALNVVELDCTAFKANRQQIYTFTRTHNIGTVVYIDPPMFWSANLYFKLWGVKVIAYVRYSHGFIHMNDYTIRSCLKRVGHEFGLLSAHKYIAITKSGQSKLTSAIGIPARKVEYIRNGVDSSLFANIVRTPSRCRTKRVVSVFQLRPQKNIFFILDVIKQLTNNRQDFEYVHAGGGEQLEGAKNYAKEIGIDAYCQFLGPIDSSLDFLSCADVLIHASKAENCSNVITEAMGCGVPIVAVKSDSTLEQLTDKVGTRVEDLEVNAFRQAIERYLDSPDLREQAHQLGPIRARKHFSIEEQSLGLEKLLIGR
jgi:glycosyltransferase involved in cell wall biosynthesis